MDDIIGWCIAVLIVFLTIGMGINFYITNTTLSDIRDILKSEGTGNFTDEDLEKIREIIVK